MSEAIPQPRADRSQLQQIIVGLPQGVIIIDPDQTIAWANEAALAMHGVASLKDLGANISDYRERFELRYRNRHKLPPGDYPMDRVVAGEAFTEVVVEVVRPGEEKHRIQQIRSMVISDPAGQPNCLVLVMEDQTERFSAEERFERTFAANPAPAIIARLSDMRYVKVNHGFLEMTGYIREALIGKSIHEVDVLERAEKRTLAIERLHAGATIPQMEACLNLPNGTEKTVIVAGHPIEVGDEACMLFTFADLHPRKQAEHALKQSEERFSAAFRMAPGPMAMIALDGMRLLDVNDAFTAVTELRWDGVLHGMITWGIATLLTVWLLSSAIGGIIGGGASALGGLASAAGSGVKAAALPAMQAAGVSPDMIQQQAQAYLKPASPDPATMSPQDAQKEVATDLVTYAKGGPDAAASKTRIVAIMAAQQHIPVDQATKQFDDAQAKLQQEKAQAIQTAKNAADATATAASKTSFAAFADLLIGAIAAAVGGSLAVQRRIHVARHVPQARFSGRLRSAVVAA